MAVSQNTMLLQHAHELAEQYTHDELLAIFLKPLIILSAPRAGSTLLFETLKCSDQLWSIGGESHIIYSAFPELHPSSKKFNSGALNNRDAKPSLCHLMRAFFLSLAVNNKGQRYVDLPDDEKPKSITLLEKTPRNALNVSFLNELFPGMQVVFLWRPPRENISSIIEAWEIGLQTGRFITFQNLPGWERKHWCLLLPPGWRKMKNKSIAEIAAFQWVSANEAILKDLNKFKITSWLLCDYSDLINNTDRSIKEIAEFAGIGYSGLLRERASKTLPLSSTIVTRPMQNKWKRHSKALEPLANIFTPTLKKLEKQSHL